MNYVIVVPERVSSVILRSSPLHGLLGKQRNGSVVEVIKKKRSYLCRCKNIDMNAIQNKPLINEKLIMWYKVTNLFSKGLNNS